MGKVIYTEDFKEKIIEKSIYFLENETTIREAAKQFKVSKTTFHYHITKHLQLNDILYNGKSLYEQVQEVLSRHTKEAPYRAADASANSFLIRNYISEKGITVNLKYKPYIRCFGTPTIISSDYIDDVIAIELSKKTIFITDQKLLINPRGFKSMNPERLMDLDLDNIIGKVIKQNRGQKSLKVKITDKGWIDYIVSCLREEDQLPELAVVGYSNGSVTHVVCADINIEGEIL